MTGSGAERGNVLGPPAVHYLLRPTSLLASSLVLAVACSDTPTEEPAGPTIVPPNILVLMAEDLSARVGAFGDPVARTPNIDRLAAEGVRFPNTFTAAGVCAPSRAAFITAMHQTSLGAQHMRTSTSPIAAYLAVPPPEVKAFPELLRQAGYFTYTDSKLDYQFSGVTAGDGSTRASDPGPFTIWDATGRTAHYRDRPAGTPFFGLINFGITHESALFDEDYLRSIGNEAGALGARRVAEARAALFAESDALPTDPRSVAVPAYYPDHPDVRRDIATLYDNVQVMDSQVGRILAELEADGLLDNTIVIWTTDHGDPLPRAKRELFDSGIRVPMVVRWPESLRPTQYAAGAEDLRLVSFVDLGPAILAMAGLPTPTFQHGFDPFAPAAPQRDYIYASRDRIDEQIDRVRAVRDRRFKYLRYFHPGSPGATHLEYRDQQAGMRALWSALESGRLNEVQSAWFAPRPAEALYDLEVDPFETRNLAGDPAHTETLDRMRSAYLEWRRRVPDLSDTPEEEMAEQFWPGGIQPRTQSPEFDLDDSGTITLSSQTPGASIGYRVGDGPWQVYGQPLAADQRGGRRLTAKAVRYGWAESDEVEGPLRLREFARPASEEAEP